MRSFPSAAALALLLLVSCLSAASPFDMFLYRSFEPDANVSYSSLLCEGGYYLVSSDGHETYVVNASNGNAVTDTTALTLLLEQDVENREGYAAKISSAMAFPSLVNAAKNTSEAKCLQYIGDDSDPGCTDRQSCLVSCFSVPQCEIIVQADGFLDAAMEWDFKRKEYSSVLGAYSDGIDAIRTDSAAIDGKISLLSSLSSLAANMSNNTIFLTKDDNGCSGKNATRRCYEYCKQIDYSPSLIKTQSQDLALLKTALSRIAGQGSRAEAILNQSAENDAYLSSRGKDFEEFRTRMANDIRNLKAKSAELSRSVKDPSISPMISQLENISEKAKNYSDSGLYKKALALRVSFETISNASSVAINTDNSSYSSLKAAMKGFSDKAKNSAWLIGANSTAAHLKQIASLEANYSAPLTLSKISAASAVLSEMSNNLDAEISSKTVAAGNSTSPPPPVVQPPQIPCLPALILAPAVLFAFAGQRRRV